MSANYAIGIDLGTTNCVLAWTDLHVEQPEIHLLPIPQLVAAGTVEQRSSLPSFLYLGTEADASAGTWSLPWNQGSSFAVGEAARRQSAEIPQRTICAAKSWLCYSHVDRHGPILPWNTPDDVQKISPVEASRLYLQHLVSAWTERFPDAPICEQQVVLTVPASFDASARELTREAALAAGLPETLVLIEEPQAATYAWLDDQRDVWRKQLRAGHQLLVCDVGGGTTDLTLVDVTDDAGELQLQRRAVGNHLLVGGDNMDLALAFHVSELFRQQKQIELNPWQSVSLWHACRAAKEALLAEDGPETWPVAVPGRGSRLIGGTIAVDVNRQAVQDLLVNGFFGSCSLQDRPVRQRSSGFRELGLPFETDTLVTRHLAAFLSSHGDQQTTAQPTHVLFNGGVFKSAALRNQLLQQLSTWFQSPPIELCGERDLDYAVARGAAHYAWTKHNGGLRIRGGTARSYYIGVETAGLAIPGAPRPLHALCVVPHGMEEGTRADIAGGGIGLILGEPARFRFFSSAVRRDQPGTRLQSWTDDELQETDSLETELTQIDGLDEDYVPVRFESVISELGVLELWCVHTDSNARWKFEFSVRDDAQA
ncbi:MAG: Hsp70 family protein [Planctomycetaceae bacterium]